MKPIVSPLFFYFADVADALNFLLILLAALAVMAIIITVVFFNDIFFYEDEAESNEAKKVRRFIKVSSAIAIICILLAVVTPSKDTIYRMIISKHITTDTVNEGTDKEK